MNEAELVYSHLLNCDRLSLYLNKDTYLDRAKTVQASRIFKRRIAHEPLQYILGSCEFMGLEFKTDKRALIPRPETEILVDYALKKLKLKPKTCRPKVLDLGTGSGCIAISIAKLLPLASVWASDISKPALQLAQENADLQKVKIKFMHSDIFSAFKVNPVKFDLIISNPPYIPVGQLKGLADEISFEPVVALAAGNEGLDFYRAIISQAARYLNADGYLALEVGDRQAEPVARICATHNFNVPDIFKDYNGIKRVVITKQRAWTNG